MIEDIALVVFIISDRKQLHCYYDVPEHRSGSAIVTCRLLPAAFYTVIQHQSGNGVEVVREFAAA